MNQEEIGKFIAMCRKAEGYTQAELADKLGITDRAVSKWETGRSMPDASIMLELCGLLNISVNELLTGEHIVMDKYKEISEANILELKKKEENANKALLHFELLWFLISTTFFVLAVSACKAGEVVIADKTWRLVLTAVAVLQFIICVCVCAAIEIKAGYYECPECGHRYVPEFGSYIWGMHIGWTRKMVCPNCGKKAWQKKVYNK